MPENDHGSTGQPYHGLAEFTGSPIYDIAYLAVLRICSIAFLDIMPYYGMA